MTEQPRHSNSAYRACDVVRQDTIWKKAVQREARSARKWRENWSFLSEYDSKGQRKKTPPKPENLTYYNTNKVPVTTSKQIGNRVDSPLNRTVKQLELSMAKPSQKSDLKTAFAYI